MISSSHNRTVARGVSRFSRGGADQGGRAIDLAQLQRALAFAEPSALLVPSSVLRRVISRDRGVWFLGGRASRRTWYVIAGARLPSLVEPEEVGLPRGAPWPETVVLLARPDAEVLARTPRAQLLLVYWSRLFRARVRSTVQHAIASKGLDDAGIAARKRSIGPTEFAEAR